MIPDLTIKKLIIAAGLARKLARNEICRIAECVPSYIPYLLHDPEFVGLEKLFEVLPPDNDTKVYKGLGTILMDIGRYIYMMGEKQANG